MLNAIRAARDIIDLLFRKTQKSAPDIIVKQTDRFKKEILKRQWEGDIFWLCSGVSAFYVALFTFGVSVVFFGYSLFMMWFLNALLGGLMLIVGGAFLGIWQRELREFRELYPSLSIHAIH